VSFQSKFLILYIFNNYFATKNSVIKYGNKTLKTKEIHINKVCILSEKIFKS